MKDILGDMELKDIRPMDCQRVLNRSQEEDESGESTRKLRIIMHGVFADAVDNEMIEKNPVIKSVNCKYKKSEERRILTVAEQEKFLEMIADSSYAPVFKLVLQTGLRCGEVQGLKWSDVDWVNRIITVKRSLEYRKDLKMFVENPPKSKAGNRIIPMTEESERILQEVYKKRDEIPVVTEYADYVFRNPDGKPAHRGSYNKVLRRVAKEMGIEAFSMHCLRHTFATRAIEAGINPKSLQKILGHSTLSLTMDLYVHVTDDTLFSEMKKFESKRADAETEEHQEEDQETEE